MAGWRAIAGRWSTGCPPWSSTRRVSSSADILLQSALVCPLIVGDEVIGTIAVFHHEAESYTEDHRRVLDQVAHQAASVVHNALMFERTQEQAFKDGLTGLANPRALQFQVRARVGTRPPDLVAVLAGSAGSRRLQDHQR